MQFLLLVFIASVAIEARDAAYSAGNPDNSDVLSEIQGVTSAIDELQSAIGSVEGEVSSLQMEVSSLRSAIYFR
ncbi:MAG: hypothetical protein ACR2HJ_05350 [Fimbriimonadales bacterium]